MTAISSVCTPSTRPHTKTPATGAPADQRVAERILRDVAFVLQATRAVRQSILEGDAARG